MWGIFNIVISVLTFLFLKETKDLSLEAIAHQRYNKKASIGDLDHAKSKIRDDRSI